jgi:hypothetical protein
MEPTFLISLIGTLLWLAGLFVMSRSLRAGMALQLASTGVFAVLNVVVAAYPGLLGSAVGAVLLLRAIRDAGRQSACTDPAHPEGALPARAPDLWMPYQCGAGE